MIFTYLYIYIYTYTIIYCIYIYIYMFIESENRFDLGQQLKICTSCLPVVPAAQGTGQAVLTDLKRLKCKADDE
jgi:hypothetical protein